MGGRGAGLVDGWAAALLLVLGQEGGLAWAQPQGSNPTSGVGEDEGDAEDDFDILETPGAGQDPEGSPSGSTATTRDVEFPELIGFVQAHYPEEARQRRLEGEVLLELEVDPQGNVVSARVVEEAGNGFDEAARQAALDFLFRPARRGGRAVAAKLHYLYTFSLDAEGEPLGTPHRTSPSRPAAEASESGDRDSHTAPAATRGPTGATPDLSSAPIEITVEGDREPSETARSLSREQLVKMPGTLGDPLRAIQNLPGVGVPPFGEGQLVVRGTSPRDSLVFVDGLYVINAYHLWGLSSVVPSEMLERLDFYPGNYGVDRGRGLGGIVELTTRRAAADGEYHGLAQVDFIDARGMLEGPLPGARGWSFLGGARHSYFERTVMPVLDWDVAPSYYDYQAFFETSGRSNSFARIGFMGSSDRFEFKGERETGASEYSFHYLFGTYESRWDDVLRWRQSLAVGVIHQAFEYQAVDGDLSVNAPAYPWNLREDLTWTVVPAIEVGMGVDLQYAYYEAKVDVPQHREAGAPPTESGIAQPHIRVETQDIYFRPAGYTQLLLKPTERTRLVGGVRADYDHSTASWDFSPRGRISQSLGAPETLTTLKAGVGLHHQPPQTEETMTGYGSPGLHSSRALHLTAGVEQRLFQPLEVSVEGFAYQLTDLVSPTANEEGVIQFRNDMQGSTLGLESLVRFSAGDRLEGWVAYTLSRARRRFSADEPWHSGYFDQTHVLTALGSLGLGRGWEIGLKFQYASGTPYTPVRDALYSASSDEFLPVLAGHNEQRLPDFHQLDLRVEKRWDLRWGSATLYGDVINTYANRRVIGIRYNDTFTRSEWVEHPLPVIPNLGFRLEF